MKHGFIITGGSPSEQVDLAVDAEAAGWDGVFVAETAAGVDPWSLLAAIAVRTERVRLGTMLTPLPWRRPWKLASQVATVDHLSGSRAILTVGLGAADPALGDFGEPTDRATRAVLLDEGIDVIQAVWSDEPVFSGDHHRVDLTEAVAVARLQPVQRPRVPIWCVGAGGSERSMRRALRCDGLVPTTVAADGARQSTPEEIAGMLEWLTANGAEPGRHDVVVEGESEPGDPSPLEPWQAAGATWWLESRWTEPDLAAVRRRLLDGPAER